MNTFKVFVMAILTATALAVNITAINSDEFHEWADALPGDTFHDYPEPALDTNLLPVNAHYVNGTLHSSFTLQLTGQAHEWWEAAYADMYGDTDNTQSSGITSSL